MWWLRRQLPRAGQKVTREIGSRRFTTTLLRGTVEKLEVVEDFESRLHKAVSFLVEREKLMQEWNEEGYQEEA